LTEPLVAELRFVSALCQLALLLQFRNGDTVLRVQDSELVFRKQEHLSLMMQLLPEQEL
jgi:hypothetical protein